MPNPQQNSIGSFAFSDYPPEIPPAYEPKPGSTLGLSGNIPLPPTFTTSGASIRNYRLAISAWGAFNSVRLLFANHQTVEATIDNHRVGVVASAFAGANGAMNIDNPTGGWSALAGPVTVPAAIGATQSDRNKRPGLILGPELFINSIPRAANEPDGGLYELLLIRLLTLQGNANVPIVALQANFPGRYDQINEGLSILSTAIYTGTDFTTQNMSTLNFSGAREDNPAFPIFGALFNYTEPFTSVTALGDSIMAGESDGYTNRAPWSFKALARLRKTGKRVAYQNCAVTGSNMSEILARGSDLLNIYQPDIVTIACNSINSFVDGLQSDWDNQWATCMANARNFLAKGKRVVLLGPLPNQGYNAAINVGRLRQRQRCIDSGLPFIDVEFLADANGKFKDSGDRTDNTHLSNQGQDRVSYPAYDLYDRIITK